MFWDRNDKVVNRMNSTNLESFKIWGLFGRYNVFLPFEKTVNIYIGENGLGKTTILNCLYYVLEKKFTQLESIDFETIELKFKNDENIYSIAKADLRAYLQKRSASHAHNGYGEDFWDILLSDVGLAPEELGHLSRERIEILARQYASIRDVPYSVARNRLYHYRELQEMATTRGKIKGDAKKVPALAKAITNNIKERIIYLPTYRRIENDFSNLKIGSREINGSEMLIRFGMADVQMSIDSILTNIRDIAMTEYNAMTGILLRQYTEGNNFFTNLNDKLDIDIVQIILDRLGKQIDDKYKERIVRIIESEDIYSEKYDHLLNLLHKLVANYDRQKHYDDHIKSFVNVCNRYLNDKSFHYNPSNLTLDIYLEELGKVTQAVKLTQLSSGEKQIVSLFSKLYLESEEPCIIIIDEPELSLSINWQQMLLPDIVRSRNCAFLLTVTHSPFIFENEFDMDAKEIRTHITMR